MRVYEVNNQNLIKKIIMTNNELEFLKINITFTKKKQNQKHI